MDSPPYGKISARNYTGLYGLLSLLCLEVHSKYILNWKACKAYVYPIYVVKGFAYSRNALALSFINGVLTTEQGCHPAIG
jgi:hypothetical protein